MSDQINEGPNRTGEQTPYVVTRGKPPREHQFRPGQSGNPRGRPRGSRDIRTLLQQELDRPIPVTMNGKTTKVSRREALVMRLVEKAMQGDLRALETVFKHVQEEAAASSAPPMDTDPARDAEIMRAYLARLEEGAGHA